MALVMSLSTGKDIGARQGGGKLRRTRLARMKTRAEFQILTASPNKYFTPGLVIQAAPCRHKSTPSMPVLSPANDTAQEIKIKGKLGFTASRKVGNAVMRNRAKRRMRAASDIVMSGRVRQDWDFVLVARQATATRPWADLLADLEMGLRKLRAFS